MRRNPEKHIAKLEAIIRRLTDRKHRKGFMAHFLDPGFCHWCKKPKGHSRTCPYKSAKKIIKEKVI